MRTSSSTAAPYPLRSRCRIRCRDDLGGPSAADGGAAASGGGNSVGEQRTMTRFLARPRRVGPALVAAAAAVGDGSGGVGAGGCVI